MEQLTKDDLLQLRILLIRDIERLIKTSKNDTHNEDTVEWLRSRVVRGLLGISAGTLQNLRVTRKIRYRKIMGSYYYSKVDLDKLFGDG